MRDTKKHQKNFSLKRFESWEAAEAEAENWVKNMKRTLPASRMNEEGRMTKRNASGVVGVTIAKSTRKKPSGLTYEYWKWIAKWPDCPFKGGVTWPINSRTTDEDAFVLACLSREMRSANRGKVRHKFEKIRGTKAHHDILETKLLQLK